MSYPDLPLSVKGSLAAEAMREHHHLWHLARSRAFWQSITPAERNQLTAQGWKAPRFDDEPGAGLDFLSMHRNMIPHVNQLMSLAGDPAWTKVAGWNPLPFDPQDADWPVPPSWPGIDPGIENTKKAASVPPMQKIATQVEDPKILKKVTLDQLGSAIEGSIHGWMHYRWSAKPPTADLFDIAPENDWLGAPWSSHVNKHFWKLHGWIDDKIGSWERANNTTADFSTAWNGPHAHPHAMAAHPDHKSLRRAAQSFKFRSDPQIADRLLDISSR